MAEIKKESDIDRSLIIQTEVDAVIKEIHITELGYYKDLAFVDILKSITSGKGYAAFNAYKKGYITLTQFFKDYIESANHTMKAKSLVLDYYIAEADFSDYKKAASKKYKF